MTLKKRMFSSTVSRKFVMALTGLALVVFTIGHLIGNLQLLIPDNGVAFNSYAHKLISLGPILYVIELALLAVVLAHVVYGIWVTLTSKAARGDVAYAAETTKGGDSRRNASSLMMWLWGLVLLAFIVFHVIHFKYGAGVEDGYVTTIHNEEVRDLNRLVVEEFQKPHIVIIYLVAMVMLGLHLRHGIWSAFQSIGLMPAPYSGLLYLVFAILGVAIAIGFFILPIWIAVFPQQGS